MPRILFQEWWERDSWSGPSRSGYTLHKTLEDKNRYITRYWDGMPDDVPESFVSPEGEPVWIELPDYLYEMFSKSLDKGFGMRFYSNIKPGQVEEMLKKSFRQELIDEILEIEAERA